MNALRGYPLSRFIRSIEISWGLLVDGPGGIMICMIIMDYSI